MAKDKKSKAAEKKARVAAKQNKKAVQKGKKVKSKVTDDSDAEDVDLESVLAEYARKVGNPLELQVLSFTIHYSKRHFSRLLRKLASLRLRDRRPL